MTREEARAALVECRVRIDGIDRQIVDLLNERTRVVERIGQVKRAVNLPVYEPRREDEVFQNVASHNTGPLPQESAQRIFERVMDEMRTLQKMRMTRECS